MRRSELWLLMIGRYFVACILGLFPFAFNPREEWYVIPLIWTGFAIQHIVATFHLWEYFIELRNLKNRK